MRCSLSKYTFCVKCALSYTASKFQAFAVVPVAYLQAVSLTHTYLSPNWTFLPQVMFLLLPSSQNNWVFCTVDVFLFDIRHYHWCAQIPVAMASKFCLVAPDICGSSIWNLLCVTLVAHRILRWLIDFWKVFASLLYNNERYVLLEAHSKTVD